MKRLYRKCPICENEYGKVLKNIKMELPENVKIPKEYEVVCCSKCGFTYADVDASQKDYNDYYEFNNVYSKNATIKFVGIHKRHILCCEFLEEYIKKNDRILDVGCGSGELLRTLKDRGFSNLVGLDPSEESIAILNQYGIEGIRQNIFDVIPNDLKNQFHVVISTVVLEHIYDVNLFVKQMVDYLMPGGVLYILVPAVEGFEIQCSQIPDYFNQEHINYFSLQSTDNLFGKYGFIRKSSNDKSLIRLGSDDLMVNAVYSYAERPVDRTMNIIKDEKSAKSILNYLNKVQCKEDKKYQKLLDVMKTEQLPIVVWGAGAYTLQLLGNVPDLKDRIIYFVDNNEMKIGTTILGKGIYSPKRLLEETMKYPILVCSMKNSSDIEKEIKAMELDNLVIKINEI